MATIFSSDLFAISEDDDTHELSVEFLAGRGFDLVPARFLLLPSERHLYSDVGYIRGLIQAYLRDPGRFRTRRHVENPSPSSGPPRRRR